jgi:putative mRNA 3-end processing factor
VKRRRPPEEPVEWRGGVHLRGTHLWCDARRTREACFVSSALVSEARNHRQIIATQTTLALLPGAGALAAKRAPRALAVPYARPFTLGDLRLELFPSGAMPGAASLLIDTGGRRVVYAGRIDTAPGRLGGAAEVRACDVLVLDAAFGHPRFAFPPAADVLAEVRAWVDATLAEGRTPVLLAPPLALGLDLLAALGRPIRAHRALVEAARRLRALGTPLPPAQRLPAAPGDVILWPPARREAAAIAQLPGARVALVSGWARDPDTVARLRVDAAFPLAEQAGHEALVAYARATGAATIYLLGGGDVTRAFVERGVRALRLGPPEQLTLL